MHVAYSILVSDKSFGAVRNKITKQVELLSFAKLIWKLFRALMNGVFDTLNNGIPKSTIDLTKSKINTSTTNFLDSALQLEDG